MGAQTLAETKMFIPCLIEAVVPRYPVHTVSSIIYNEKEQGMLVMIYSVWLAVLKALPSARAVAPTFPPKYYLLEQIAPVYIFLLSPPKWACVKAIEYYKRTGKTTRD